MSQISSINLTRKESTYLLGYVALGSATVAVFSYWLMTYYDVLDFPAPSSHPAIVAGSIYLVSLSLAVASGLPFILIRAFPSIRVALADKGSLRVAIILAIGYFFTYLILVNQFIITSFNTPPGNYVPPPFGVYPWASAITAGPAPGSQLESAVYVPLFTIQLNQFFNMIMMPFEFAFAIALSILVACSIALALHLISRRSSNSCYTGATVSGLGSFFGFTATCPTCLAPTLVSVLSGGVSATAPVFYTHLTGVLLPPIISIFALLVGLAILDYQAGRRLYPLKRLMTLVPRGSSKGNADYVANSN
ncbi:MAG: hypothetical protein JRN15_01910 [Nitrososphaerota archaeon]|nr:hypothetical protein [Nitrososphaerota archaeon]